MHSLLYCRRAEHVRNGAVQAQPAANTAEHEVVNRRESRAVHSISL